MKRVCLVPSYSSTGGPASFQANLTAGLSRRGIAVTRDLADLPYDALLVIGGTRSLGGLRRVQRAGVPIVQRLNGMNWLHRRRRTGLRHFLRAEYGNLNLRLIRSQFADRIIYQSQFARDWWEHAHGTGPSDAFVVHNGVDLEKFSPQGAYQRPAEVWRVLLVEGNLLGGYEIGLDNALGLVKTLNARARRPVELMVVGQVPEKARTAASQQAGFPVHWAGFLAHHQIPEIDRSAHLLYSADLNPACPNAVIEALACGLPVAALETGSLGELVSPQAGVVTPYGGDPWQLDPPDLDTLAVAAHGVLQNQDPFRAGARRQAEAHFSLEAMVTAYLEVLAL